jgi:dUTP pyrophosphatase
MSRERTKADLYLADRSAGMTYAEITKMKMKVVLDPGAVCSRAHQNDAGLDLCATKGGWIFPKCRKTFGTGLHAAIPEGFVGMLTSKSGLMAKGISSRGTIDSGYTGEIRAVLFNHGWRFVRIKKGQKITQLVIMPIITPEVEVVEELEETERGDGGFGSTGAF